MNLTPPTPPEARLAQKLKADREALSLSFAEVERITDRTCAAEVAALEAGAVKFPAPHVLFYLASAYSTSYVKYMQLAGHIRPKPLTGELHAHAN